MASGRAENALGEGGGGGGGKGATPYMSRVFGELLPEKCKTLIVGDGDFSYSASLCKLYDFSLMVSTSTVFDIRRLPRLCGVQRCNRI